MVMIVFYLCTSFLTSRSIERYVRKDVMSIDREALETNKRVECISYQPWAFTKSMTLADVLPKRKEFCCWSKCR